MFLFSFVFVCAWVECQGEGNTKSHLNIQAGAAAQFRAQVAM